VRLADALSNLGCGLGQIVTRPLYDAGFVLLYLAVYEHARVATLGGRSLGTWVVTLFATDFLYYVYHRLAHGTRFMWAWHGVHHQSESYDLWVSFRLSWLGPPAEKVFYLPLALAGLPVEAVLAATAYSSFFQFFVHTRAVPRLGPLDWLLNTPSNHRVHHGVEAKYIDKNFAGMFVVWDRLFGTYQPEEEEPTYGVPRAFESKSPLFANLAYFVEWARGVPRIVATPVRASRAPPGRLVLRYAAAQTVVLAGLTLACFAWAADRELVRVAVLAVVVIAGVSSVGLMLDASPWGTRAELGRQLALLVAAILVPMSPAMRALLALPAVLALGFLGGTMLRAGSFETNVVRTWLGFVRPKRAGLSNAQPRSSA
jgi:sterol desaturase/sphingolipid hydroxylase (fatty acid hydroxylase superfamily)